MLLLRSLLFFLLMPGTITVFLPCWLLGGAPVGHARRTLLLPGALAILAGASILLRCVWQFYSEGKGTLAPIDPPAVLVVRGLYRYVRNPMYVGVMLILLGEALLFLSWKLGLELLLFFLTVHAFIKYYEEPTLRRQFGGAYDEYLRSVGRWFPRW